jgi:hypothetical protein
MTGFMLVAGSLTSVEHRPSRPEQESRLMQSYELFTICISAFMAVFVLLTVLAIIMRLIIAAFPAREVTGDAAMVAAVSTVMQNIYPGTKVTKVEEIK